jgi:5-methylcytosine rRNA methyltransferase NSUN4
VASQRGAEEFDKYYRSLYGERWSTLKEALLKSPEQIARPNLWAAQTGAESYQMDKASLFPALALAAHPGEAVLDMCAAPGGKSLIIAENMKGEGRLVVNELSENRRSRLFRVIREYIPEDIRKNLVEVTGRDAARWCLYEQDVFDRVLLDAPCSGERHLLKTPSEIAEWSPSRTKNLAKRQYALLASAHQVVKPGGTIVYSTCSISNLENDGVIERLVKKRAGEVEVVRREWEIGEPTEFGWIILPDQTGYGPIYFSELRRV